MTELDETLEVEAKLRAAGRSMRADAAMMQRCAVAARTRRPALRLGAVAVVIAVAAVGAVALSRVGGDGGRSTATQPPVDEDVFPGSARDSFGYRLERLDGWVLQLPEPWKVAPLEIDCDGFHGGWWASPITGRLAELGCGEVAGVAGVGIAEFADKQDLGSTQSGTTVPPSSSDAQVAGSGFIDGGWGVIWSEPGDGLAPSPTEIARRAFAPARVGYENVVVPPPSNIEAYVDGPAGDTVGEAARALPGLPRGYSYVTAKVDDDAIGYVLADSAGSSLVPTAVRVCVSEQRDAAMLCAGLGDSAETRTVPSTLGDVRLDCASMTTCLWESADRKLTVAVFVEAGAVRASELQTILDPLR